MRATIQIHFKFCYRIVMKFIRWLREYLDRESGNGKARESFWDDPNGGSTTDLERNSIEQHCFKFCLEQVAKMPSLNFHHISCLTQTVSIEFQPSACCLAGRGRERPAVGGGHEARRRRGRGGRSADAPGTVAGDDGLGAEMQSSSVLQKL